MRIWTAVGTLLGSFWFVASGLAQIPRAPASSPSDERSKAESLFALVSTELKLGHVDKARTDLTQFDKLAANDPELFYRLGKLLLENRLFDEAGVEFERAANMLEAGGSHPPGLKLSHVYLQLAQLLFNQHDYWGALRFFDKIEPGSVEPKLRAGSFNLEGAAFLGVWKPREAREKLRQAVQMDPSKPEYLVHLAWAELLAGDIKAARATVVTAERKWPQLLEVQGVVPMVERERIPERAGVPLNAEWHLKGEGFVSCPCAVPCPCRSNGLPTYGHCEYAGAFRVAKGHYGQIPLDGFIFAVANGSMEPQGGPPVLYVDPSATGEQLIALERVFQTFNPLQPFVFLIVKRAKISFSHSAPEEVYEARIPGLLQLKIHRQLDSKGQPLLPTAALDFLSNTIEYARNLVFRVSDEKVGFKWDFSGRQANFRVFDVDSQDYGDGRMLAQFADASGFFNKKQLELIKTLKLPTLSSYPNERK